MIRPAASMALMLAVCAASLDAGAPEHSPRPVLRGSVAVAASPQRPRQRPGAAGLPAPAAVVPERMSFLAPDTSPMPFARPDSVVEAGLFKRRKQRRGAICDDIDIQGDAVGRVAGNGACGISDAVRVRSVAGVTLSQSALMDCDTARALKHWVERGAKPAFRRRGPLVEMRVAAHYVCRTRNGQSGARLSEHGRGKAIDISAFTMKDGEVITVLAGWGEGTTQKPLTKAWRTACGTFGTVLGPNSDGYHRDHFHLDTASYRNGPYCK
jgi:hypothetical protein